MPPESLTLFDIVPGKKVGDRFAVVGPHRQGGFSTAFEVTDEKDGGARCELQLFPSGLFEEGNQAGDFLDDLRVWMEVESDFVVPMRQVLEEGDTVAIIFAYPPGETLRERLKREGALSRDEVLSIGRGLLRGLVSIHEKSLVHGDIKPYAIYVEGTGKKARPALVDGGFTHGLWTAKGLGDQTALIGTPYYAPIEQFGGDAPDVRSDIYNVATVLFECAAGVLPWTGVSFLEVFQCKLQDPPPMIDLAPDVTVDPALENVIRTGCLADRNRRYATASEFLAELDAIA